MTGLLSLSPSVNKNRNWSPNSMAQISFKIRYGFLRRYSWCLYISRWILNYPKSNGARSTHSSYCCPNCTYCWPHGVPCELRLKPRLELQVERLDRLPGLAWDSSKVRYCNSLFQLIKVERGLLNSHHSEPAARRYKYTSQLRHSLPLPSLYNHAPGDCADSCRIRLLKVQWC